MDSNDSDFHPKKGSSMTAETRRRREDIEKMRRPSPSALTERVNKSVVTPLRTLEPILAKSGLRNSPRLCASAVAFGDVFRFMSMGMPVSPVPSFRARAVKACQGFSKAPDERPFARFVLILCCLLLIGCGSTELHPVELLPDDMCAFCKMAISEKRFASELITQDGEALKFDDIGCLLRFRKERSYPELVAATFVVDFETHEWLRSEEAYFVKSKEFRTPMDGNWVAFRAKASAAAASARYQGVQLGQEALLQ